MSLPLAFALHVSAYLLLLGPLVTAQGNGVPVNPVSPTSLVPGHVFNRYVVIWLENTVRTSAPAERIG
jgi:hypothetical protein